MGTGNMEQAPEFFGDAAARQVHIFCLLALLKIDYCINFGF